MPYEVILFDADETLFDFKKAEKDALKNTMLQFEIDYDETTHLEIYSTINAAIWKDFENGLITQHALKAERFRRFARHIHVHFDSEQFAKSYMFHLSQASYLYEDSKPLVKGLCSEYKLSIITNGLTDVQQKRIRESEIAKYLVDVVISEEVGVSKPDPKIFTIALANINHDDKATVLMVGDSLTSDVQGGIDFGIDTCWYNPNKVINDTEIKPTYEIASLMELKSILK
ncbi:MAG: noncanonical pyrimidine nucleotidase, YjjG family [Vallitaleaceae bacterium]|nr:noncanonical pyrimidine nucleotidase, YjjG family [Vallitaleaceae bacterium]